MSERKSNPGEESELPEWNPEWDFLEPEDIEKQIDETNAFLRALEDLAPEDQSPDHIIPKGSRDILLPLFDAAMNVIAKEDRKAMSGDVVMNFKQYKHFRDAYNLLKELAKQGIVKKIEHGFKITSKPIELRFRTSGSLDLKGECKDRFAEAVCHTCRFTARQIVSDMTVYKGMEFSLMFPDMWIPISKLGTPITKKNI